MGKPNPVLLIVVADCWAQHPDVQALRDAGHNVRTLTEFCCCCGELGEPDLILHPAAHGWNDHLWPYLDAALKAARKRRKERK